MRVPKIVVIDGKVLTKLLRK